MFQKIMVYAVDGDASELQFAMANARKDVGYYAAMAAAHGLPSPLGTAALQLFTLACATGHGDEHVPLLDDVMAELGGLERSGTLRNGSTRWSSGRGWSALHAPGPSPCTAPRSSRRRTPRAPAPEHHT